MTSESAANGRERARGSSDRSPVPGTPDLDTRPPVRVRHAPGPCPAGRRMCQGGARFALRAIWSPFQRTADRDTRRPVRMRQAPGPRPADPRMCRGGARFKVSRSRPVVQTPVAAVSTARWHVTRPQRSMSWSRPVCVDPTPGTVKEAPGSRPARPGHRFRRCRSE